MGGARDALLLGRSRAELLKIDVAGRSHRTTYHFPSSTIAQNSARFMGEAAGSDTHLHPRQAFFELMDMDVVAGGRSGGEVVRNVKGAKLVGPTEYIYNRP